MSWYVNRLWQTIVTSKEHVFRDRPFTGVQINSLLYGLSCWTSFGHVSDKLDPWLVVSCDMNKHPNTKEPVIPMGIVNYILLIVLRLLNVYFRLIFRSLDPLILKFVGPPTHVTKITYFSFPSMPTT